MLFEWIIQLFETNRSSRHQQLNDTYLCKNKHKAFRSKCRNLTVLCSSAWLSFAVLLDQSATRNDISASILGSDVQCINTVKSSKCWAITHVPNYCASKNNPVFRMKESEPCARSSPRQGSIHDAETLSHGTHASVVLSRPSSAPKSTLKRSEAAL